MSRKGERVFPKWTVYSVGFVLVAYSSRVVNYTLPNSACTTSPCLYIPSGHNHSPLRSHLCLLPPPPGSPQQHNLSYALRIRPRLSSPNNTQPVESDRSHFGRRPRRFLCERTSLQTYLFCRSFIQRHKPCLSGYRSKPVHY